MYKITNRSDEPANYSVLVNAFDKDGDYVGQTYIGAEHLAAGKTDADKSEFTSYGSFKDKHELSDIASVKVAYVERMALAN
ncbi:FxLYD domain-containing protein [Streptomyces sp. NPDC003470]|uniref:FxLYD domain-containing protein n=1 Tax=Streptomyces sp. NPDC127100 TaxID=3347138 RepID=UPI00364AC978